MIGTAALRTRGLSRMTAPIVSRGRLVGALLALLWAAPAAAQVAPCPPPVKTDGTPALPPATSPLLVRCISLVAHPINETLVDPSTYDYYIKTPQTVPSAGVWAPYAEDAVKPDFWGLWRTNFLDNLWIEVIDEPFPNGVAARHIVFH